MEQPLQVAIFGCGWASQRHAEAYKQCNAVITFLLEIEHFLTDLGLHQASEAAFIKLLAALPSISRHDAEYVRQRIYVDAAGWHSTGENIAFLPTLQEAIWQERKLRLTYRRGDGNIVERLVDPLGLVAKGSIWYLVAAVENEVRTYRVSRVQEALVTDSPCVRPKDFDLAAYWGQSSARFLDALPRYPATVRIDPAVLSQLRRARYIRIEEVGPPDEEGWLKLAVQFETEEEACDYVLRLGLQIEVQYAST